VRSDRAFLEREGRYQESAAEGQKSNRPLAKLLSSRGTRNNRRQWPVILQSARLRRLAGSLGSQETELIVKAHHFIAEVIFRRRHHEGIEALVFNQAVTVFTNDDML
nr:hypothetical protein [Tanacetum cinerariifolium]